MRTIKLIVSDLHVASGDPLLDGFGQRQQAALVNATTGESSSASLCVWEGGSNRQYRELV